MKRLATTLVAIAAIFAAMTPVAAHAQSGGGCASGQPGQNYVSSCSSYSNYYGRQSGDFYMNSLAGNECTAQLWMYNSVLSPGWEYEYTVVLDHTGRYPEMHRYTTASGWGRTQVLLYDCSGNFMYYVNSPVINFP